MSMHKSFDKTNEAVLAYADNLTNVQQRRLEAGYMTARECEELCEAHYVALHGRCAPVNYGDKRDTLTDSQYVRLRELLDTIPEADLADPSEAPLIYGYGNLRSAVFRTRWGFVAEFPLDKAEP